MKYPLLLCAALLTAAADAQGQSDSARLTKPTVAPKAHQAKAPPTQPFGAEAFDTSQGTSIRWLGMAGFLINSRGTTLMVDPLLEGFDMPVMIAFPIAAHAVPRLDAVLVTHSDNDHYSVPTNKRWRRSHRYSTPRTTSLRS